MGRAPLVTFIAVLFVAALSAAFLMTERREVIASTPSAYTGLTVPLALPAYGEACADEIVYDAHSGIARFGATASAGMSAPALQVVARGNLDGRYRNDYESVARIAGGWRGTRQFDVPLRPPSTAVYGTFCVRNLENRPVDLVGTHNGRAYARPTVRVNGEQVATELQLRLLQPGRHSLVSRLGQVTAHASTLKPFGAWWWWVLALGLLTLAPLAVARAIGAALTMDAALAPERRAPPIAWPFARFRRRLATVPGWAIVAAVGGLAVLWFSYWGFHTHVFQNDEDEYVYLSRWLQTDFPASLWTFDMYGRGLQRLEVWLLAVPSALFDSPWSLRGGRFLNTLAFVSTAIPVYLLGRRLELRPRWAALPASVSVVVPWAVVTTGFLTENVAYPACMWAVWAIWRTAAAPSARRDVLALTLLIVAAAARSGLLLLVPVLPLVVAGTGLRYATGGALARLRTVLREHVVVWAAAALGLLVLVLGALGVAGADGLSDRLAGGYQTQLGFDLLAMLDKMGHYLAKVVVGTGFLPAAIGLPWLAIQLFRPRDRGTFCFALLVVLAAVALLYSLNAAGPDERYVLYLAPLVLLPATLALARREVSPAGLAITSILLAALLLSVSWQAEQGSFGFFVSPVEMFYTRAIGLRLDRYLPGDGDDVLMLVGISLGVAGVLLAAILRRGPARLAGAAAVILVAVVVAVVPLQTQYALSKYVNGAGSKSAPGDTERAFVDRALPGGPSVGVFAEGVGQQPDFFPIFKEVQFYNQRIDSVVSMGENVNPVPPGDQLVSGVSYDPRTGRLTSPAPLPDYLVIPTPVGAVRVRGEIVSAPSYVAVALLRVAKPATLDWSASGFTPTGELAGDAGGAVRFYGKGLRPGAYCAAYALIAPPDRETTWRIERDGRSISAGTLEPGASREVTVPLSQLAERGIIDLTIRGDGLRVGGIRRGADC